MKSIEKLFILLIFSCLLILPNVYAKDNYLNVSDNTNKNVEHSMFTAGDDVSTNNNIKGIDFTAGNNLSINGSSEYGLIAGNSINFKGLVTRDLFIAGNQIVVDSNANLARDLYVAGNKVTVSADIKGNIFLVANEVIIDSKKIDGDITLSGGKLTISNDTKIQFFYGSYDNNGVLDVAAVDVSTFPELTYEVNFSNFNASYTIKDFLQDLAEATGCFLIFHKQNSTTVNNSYIGLDIVLVRTFLDMQLLYPSSTLYPKTSLYPLFVKTTPLFSQVPIVHKIDWYINAVVSTEPVKPYKYFSVYMGNKKIFTAASAGKKSNTEYKISNNMLLEKANANEISNITYAPMALTSDLNYFTIKLDMPYLAYLQPGDFIMFESEWGTYILPIVNVQVRGINSLRATVSCELKTT